MGRKSEPYMYLVGEKTPIGYVHILDDTFTFDNPIAAFDLNFKIFLALNLKYPRRTSNIWNFVQQGVYGLKTANDSNVASSTVITIISDIRNIT